MDNVNMVSMNNNTYSYIKPSVSNGTNEPVRFVILLNRKERRKKEKEITLSDIRNRRRGRDISRLMGKW